jgi:hypothetical protein
MPLASLCTTNPNGSVMASQTAILLISIVQRMQRKDTFDLKINAVRQLYDWVTRPQGN